MRDNTGYTREAKRKLAVCMIKNIDKARET
jgi:hypothetical protein